MKKIIQTIFVVAVFSLIAPSFAEAGAGGIPGGATVPTVTTPTVSSITTTGATLGADITGSPIAVLERGTCWGTTTAPTTNCLAEGGTTLGVFTQTRTGMTAGTTYYYRGYAKNLMGTGYSTSATFVTAAFGTVAVSSNISSSWTITGPATITGSGTSQSSASQPTGTYTITWASVPGYVSPPTTTISASQTLTTGGTITFNGTYTALASCTLPWGGTIASGNSATAYQSSLVTAPTTCASVSESRTCTNGTLSGTYINQSCVVASSCTLPWGGSIASGASAPAYLFSSVPSPATCASVSETRTCTNGTLSGTYANQSCVVVTSCNLPWGGTIASGSSITAYQSSSVTSPATCASVSQARTCNSGTLSGTYTNQNCTAGALKIRYQQF